MQAYVGYRTKATMCRRIITMGYGMAKDSELQLGRNRVSGMGAGGKAMRRKPRADAFGKAKREAFLAALAYSANIRHACRKAGVALATVYRTRYRDPGFAEAWHRAITYGVVDLEVELLERARKGSETTIKRSSGCNEVRRSYSDRLAMFLVSRHRPQGAMPPPAGRSADELCDELERRLAAIAARPSE